jgi:hypothetical protein
MTYFLPALVDISADSATVDFERTSGKFDFFISSLPLELENTVISF